MQNIALQLFVVVNLHYKSTWKIYYGITHFKCCLLMDDCLKSFYGYTICFQGLKKFAYYVMCIYAIDHIPCYTKEFEIFK